MNSASTNALNSAARLWFLVAVAGQWMFVAYIVSFYGGLAVQGDFEGWNQNLMHGYSPGQTMHNLALASHLLLAAIITIGGPLQLIPDLRARLPAFHRWNGRVYMLTAFVLSIGGLFLTWTREHLTGRVGQVGFSINALLIMVFAGLALRHALARELRIHRRWALRLFMVVSGVWFFRVGLMAWTILAGGPVGFDPVTLRGPFITFIIFAQYLLPLAILEVYLRTVDGAGASGRFAMAVVLLVVTGVMGVGIYGATVGMWLPHML